MAQEKKLKHLEFIEGIIGRMAGNLFFLRGWVVTLIAGILVLLTQIQKGKLPIIFLTVLIIIFWLYDGYFLSLERLYKDLYDKVRAQDEKDIDFSMKVDEFKKFKKNSIIFCIFSKTLLFFYGPLLL